MCLHASTNSAKATLLNDLFSSCFNTAVSPLPQLIGVGRGGWSPPNIFVEGAEPPQYFGLILRCLVNYKLLPKVLKGFVLCQPPNIYASPTPMQLSHQPSYCPDDFLCIEDEVATGPDGISARMLKGTVDT